MRVVVCLLLLALAGCASTPPASTAPEVIRVPVRIYVPIPDALTASCPWARDAAPSQVFERAAERRRCLEQYEGQLKAVRGVQGRPVPEG